MRVETEEEEDETERKKNQHLLEMSNDEICWAKSQLNVLKFHFFFSATVVVVVRTKPRIHNFNYKGKKEEPTEQTKQEWKVSQ